MSRTIAPVHRFRSSSPWQRWLIGLALSTLVAAQWLGLVHGIGHGGGKPLAAQPAASGLDAAPGAGQGLLKLITGHEEGSAFCQLFDQLSHASPLAQVPAAPAALTPEAPLFAAVPLPPRAAPALGYLARAPPFLA